jgi:hypothetical protein
MSRLVLKETFSPPTPDTGKIAIYAKADGYVYAKDDTGREVLLSNSDVSLLDHLSDADPHPQYLKEKTSRKVEYITINPTHIINKKIILDNIPINPHYVQADLKNGGGPLFLGDDFIVEGNEFKWEGLELDFIIETDDKIRIVYDHN